MIFLFYFIEINFKIKQILENKFKMEYTLTIKEVFMADKVNVSAIEKKLIVSCQALPDEPLHSSFIMGRMAKAAKEGGAKGIRANTSEDIKEIQKEVDLPIIGIVKKDTFWIKEQKNKSFCSYFRA